jgi:TolB-like protein/Tfp pilus assembly protein PilF
VTPLIRFGPFELDVDARELRSSTGRARLQDQPFEILQLLLEQPGHVVTRDRIRERLWPAGTFVDFEHSLNAAVKRLRAALGDDADEPKFIETVPRRGYRFVGCLVDDDRREDERRVRLAVLAFKNLSADRDRDFFSDGLTEEMTAQLGHLCGAKVGIVATHSAMHFKHSTLGARGIGEALRADYLLEGSTRREGDRARITARLVRTSDETQMWSETYERRLEDCLGVQADVAARIARSLAMELVPPQQSPPVSGVRGAYEAFLKGRYYWRKTADTGVHEALSYYNEALRLDPSFAAALAGISRVEVLRGEFYHEVPRLAFEKARTAAARALSLGGDMTDAHLSSADVARVLDRDLPRARASYKRAIALNPSHEGARIGFAKMLAALGEFPAAIREADDAANELDPLCLTANVTAAWVRYLSGDYETAIARCRDTLEMDENYVFARRLLGSALLASGKTAAAVRMFERAVEADPVNPVSLACLAHARAVSGNRGTAMDLLARLQEIGRTRYVSPYYVATVHAGLEDGHAVRAALKQADDDRDPMLSYLNVDPRMTALAPIAVAAPSADIAATAGR